MKYKWLNLKKNREVIIFFNGWGMDESVMKHLNYGSYDVLMFYDYNTLDTDFDFKSLEKYEKKYLIAWSMGVMTASLFDINYDRKIAINGTLKPIENNYGIPERIYDLTIRGFNEKGRERFIKSMFGAECTTLPDIKRELENQKSELSALKNYSGNQNFKYDKVILSSNDKIIPTKNQSAFWNIEPNLEGGHSPFLLFKSWEELL